MATLTVYPTALGTTSNWTANTGTKLAAVALPNDDATTYISGAAIGVVQQFTCNPISISAGSVITSIDVVARVQRLLAETTRFTVGYSFLRENGSTKSDTSAVQFAPASWTTGTTTIAIASSPRWAGQFVLTITSGTTGTTLCSTLYATITYTPKSPRYIPSVCKIRSRTA